MVRSEFKSKTLYGASILVALIFTIYLVHKNLQFRQPPAIDNQSALNSLITTSKIPAPLKTSTTTKQNSPQMQLKWQATPEQIKELRQWKLQWGWPDSIEPSNSSDYKNYPRETLEQLANQGDLRALHQLANRSPDKHIELLTKAAAYGSTMALASMAGRFLRDGGTVKTMSTFIPEKPMLLEAFAYAEVTKLRGDLSASYAIIEEVKYNNTSYSLSSDDRAYISLRTQEIYQNLESMRVELGLGKFNNSIPPIVEAYNRGFIVEY